MYVQKSLKCKINIKVSFAVQRVAENLGEIPRESQLVSERPRQFVTSQTVTDSPNKELMAGRNNWQFYFTQDINALMLFVISTYQDMCTSTITYKCARIQNSTISISFSSTSSLSARDSLNQDAKTAIWRNSRLIL